MRVAEATQKFLEVPEPHRPSRGLVPWIWLRLKNYLHPPLDPQVEHPQTEQEIIKLVKRARDLGVQLRVRGSMHCVLEGIFADKGEQNLCVQLDRYNRILKYEEGQDDEGALMRVTVQAGCHLGVDPNNPLSNKKNSLLWQIHERGWALCDLGGIIHQTVSGFISTGSMGGTTLHDLGGSIVGIRLIDGTGRVHDLAPNPGNPNDEQENPFYAAGVSMGLLGIVSTVTFKCRPRYDLIGRQDTTRTSNCAIKLFESGKDGLEHYLEGGRDPEYTRLLWWPQKGVDKVEVWRARRTGPQDKKKTFWRGRFTRRPFAAIPRILQFLIINPFYNLIAHDEPPYEPLTASLVRKVLNAFLREKTKDFWGHWLEILPMDNDISDKHMPTEFTEMFIDISQTQAVMTKLKEFFDGDSANMERTGPYAVEIYAGHKSRFWMSPCYGQHTVRVDVFWFRTKQGGRDDFFKKYWELLREQTSGVRLHWGKYLSGADSSTGATYLRQQYLMWDQFEKVRQSMDPDGVFLSTYWKEHLGIAAPLARRGLEPVKSEQPAVKAPAKGRAVRMKAAGRSAIDRLSVATQRPRLYVSLAIVNQLNKADKVISRLRRS